MNDFGPYPDAAVCMMEGHAWNGGSACTRCGDRLRCICGQFVREDAFDAHLQGCKVQVPDEWVDESASEYVECGCGALRLFKALKGTIHTALSMQCQWCHQWLTVETKPF